MKVKTFMKHAICTMKKTTFVPKNTCYKSGNIAMEITLQVMVIYI